MQFITSLNALKPREHFTHTRRSIYGRLIQCRAGHAFMGEYYNKHVPTEDRTCPCGDPLQSRDHILTACPTYENQRQALKDASEDLVTSDILGTKEGIEVLVQFLRATNAFKKHRPPTPPKYPHRSRDVVLTPPSFRHSTPKGRWQNPTAPPTHSKHQPPTRSTSSAAVTPY